MRGTDAPLGGRISTKLLMTAFLLVVLRVVGQRTGPGPEELPEALELLAVRQAVETRREGP